METKIIPTAEEFCKEKAMTPYEYLCDNLKEFAKLHVIEALKEASENVKMKIRDDVHELHMNDDWTEVDKNSILNAYPLENIK